MTIGVAVESNFVKSGDVREGESPFKDYGSKPAQHIIERAVFHHQKNHSFYLRHHHLKGPPGKRLDQFRKLEIARSGSDSIIFVSGSLPTRNARVSEPSVSLAGPE